MTEYEKSAIIGYYRMGATHLEISEITGFHAWKIIEVIVLYLKKQFEDDKEKS